MTGYLDAEGTISIHAPAKGATATTLLRLPEWKFQSTLPRRERLMWLDISVVGTIVFQSTLPRRERRLKRLKPRMRKEFQSTLPRRERQNVRADMLGILRISIHAPAKGATGQVSRSTCGQAISIHAPAKGATGFIPRIRHISQYFNPRSREGSDCISFLRQLHVPDFNPRSREGSDGFKVSIHQSLANFNPRSREGSDIYRQCYQYHTTRFQSTLPRRERQTRALRA